MSIKLDWPLFRRLIQLELLLFALFFLAIMLDYLLFSDVITALESTIAQSGYPDPSGEIVLVGGLSGLGAFLASMIGMLKRIRWARLLYLAGYLLGWPLVWLAFPPVTWTANYSGAVESLMTTVGGAVLLLAFSRDHGALWFNKLEDQH